MRVGRPPTSSARWPVAFQPNSRCQSGNAVPSTAAARSVGWVASVGGGPSVAGRALTSAAWATLGPPLPEGSTRIASATSTASVTAMPPASAPRPESPARRGRRPGRSRPSRSSAGASARGSAAAAWKSSTARRCSASSAAISGASTICRAICSARSAERTPSASAASSSGVGGAPISPFVRSTEIPSRSPAPGGAPPGADHLDS